MHHHHARAHTHTLKCSLRTAARVGKSDARAWGPGWWETFVENLIKYRKINQLNCSIAIHPAAVFRLCATNYGTIFSPHCHCVMCFFSLFSCPVTGFLVAIFSRHPFLFVATYSKCYSMYGVIVLKHKYLCVTQSAIAQFATLHTAFALPRPSGFSRLLNLVRCIYKLGLLVTCMNVCDTGPTERHGIGATATQKKHTPKPAICFRNALYC